MTSPATQEPCPKCGGDGYLLPEMLPCDACKAVLCPHTTYGNRCSMHPNCPCNTAAPPSQRAKLLTPLPAGLLDNLRCKCGNENCANIDAVKQHIAALTQRVEALKRLVLAVDGSGMCGPVCDDVNGRNWFDARQAALSQEPRNG